MIRLAEEPLPRMPKISILPKPASQGGFVYAIEKAFLGNCLSAFANLVCFAVRNNVPIVYPQLMDHAELFDFKPGQLSFFYAPKPTGFSLPAVQSLMQAVDGFMDGYYEGYSNSLNTVPPEWLIDFGELTNATVFVDYQMQFRDWTTYENAIRTFAHRSNAVVIPGAYWFQYKSISHDISEIIRSSLPLGHKDSQPARAARMADSGNIIKVGVHVRRGDYKDYKDGRYYWEISTYVELMRIITVKLSHRPHVFILCSNGVWTDRDLVGLPVCYEQGSSYDDFIALADCDYVIGPPSTYANWAAFLGRKKRLIVTPDIIARIADFDLSLAYELQFPTASGVEEDFWASPR